MVMHKQIFIANIKQIDKGEKVGIYNVVVRLRDNNNMKHKKKANGQFPVGIKHKLNASLDTLS